MARSNTRFLKRQKELARAEKRRDKMERKERRKMEKDDSPGGPPIEAIDPTDLGLPPEEDEEEEEKAAES